MEGTLKIIAFQPSCHGQGHLPLDQVAQSPIQPGLETPPQGGGIHSFSGQPLPVPHHPYRKEFLPSVQSKSTLLKFEATAPCPVTPCPCKKSLLGFLIGPLQVLEGRNKVSPQPSLLQAEQPQLSQPVLTGEVPALRSSLWPSSGPAPTAPCLSCAEGSRAGHSTPGGVSPERSRGAEFPSSPCWPRCL